MSDRGFRVSRLDAVTLSVGALASVALVVVARPGGYPGPDEALLLPVVVVHFFLFCNVLRVRRSHELIWAASFLVNATLGTFSEDGLRILVVVLVQAPMTILIVALTMGSARYRGIFCDRVRPPATR